MAKTEIKTGGIKDLNVTVAKLPAAVDISTKTVTLPATVAGLGTGISNAQLVNSAITIDGSAISLGGSVTTGTYPTFT